MFRDCGDYGWGKFKMCCAKNEVMEARTWKNGKVDICSWQIYVGLVYAFSDMVLGRVSTKDMPRDSTVSGNVGGFM